MPSLSIVLDAEGVWDDLKPGGKLHGLLSWNEVKNLTFARLPGGMQSGKASVAIRLDMNDGRVIVAETSMELFQSAARAFLAREEYEQEEHGG